MDQYIGEIRLVGFGFAPEGWLPCDGRLVPRPAYDALFAVIGEYYGGTGIDSFALPDLRGRVPIAAGQGPSLTSRLLGQMGGQDQVALGVNNLPPHGHTLFGTTAAATSPTPGPFMLPATTLPNVKPYNDVTLADGATASFAATSITENPSWNESHENHMPSIGMNFIIAVEGLMPKA